MEGEEREWIRQLRRDVLAQAALIDKSPQLMEQAVSRGIAEQIKEDARAYQRQLKREQEIKRAPSRSL